MENLLYDKWRSQPLEYSVQNSIRKKSELILDWLHSRKKMERTWTRAQ